MIRWLSRRRRAHQRLRGWRWPRRLLIAATATLAVTALLGLLLAAPIVRHIAEKQLGKLLGRRVTVSGLRVDPFTLSLTVKGLRVFEPDGQTQFLSFSRLYVNVEAVSLFRRCLVVRAVRLESVRGRVVRERGASWPGSLGDYNFSDIVARLSRPAKPPESARPAKRPRFSLADVEIIDGSVSYEDRPTATRHEIKGFTLAVPFFSSLPDDAEIAVKPRLSMRIDGAPLTVVGHIEPFRGSLEGAAEVRVSGLDFAPLVPYLPVRLPVDVVSASLSIDLDVAFARRRHVHPTLTIRGPVTLDEIAVRDHHGAPLFRLDELQVVVGQTEVLSGQLTFEKVAILGLDLHARRRRDGTLDWQRLIEAAGARESPAKRPAAQSTAAPRPRLTIEELTLEKATAHFRDESVRPGFDLTVASMTLLARNISNAPRARGEAAIDFHAEPGGVVTERGTFSLTPLAASGTVAVDGLEIARLAPYYRHLLGVDVHAGRVTLSTRYRFEQRRDGAHVALSKGTLELAHLVVHRRDAPHRHPVLRLRTLSLRDASLDLGERTVSIGLVRSRDGQVRLDRDRGGQMGFAIPATGSTQESAARPWSVQVGRLDIARWSAGFEDRSVQPPVVWSASPLAIQATGFGTGPGVRSVVDLEAGLGARGHVALKATGGLSPVSADLRFDLKDIDLPFFQPYVAPHVSFIVTQGTVSASGQARLVVPPPGRVSAASPPTIDLAANIEVANLASVDARDRERLVDWRSLRLAGLAFSTRPLRLAVNDVALGDFAARLVHRADGTWNVQRAGDSLGDPRPATAAQTPSQQSPVRPSITIGRLTLRGGRFGIVDRSIRPSFSTEVSKIALDLWGWSTAAQTDAGGALSASIDGFAPLTVAGKVNLRAGQPSADGRLDLRNLDLPRLSPYAGRYLGYYIERGKLNLAVGCHIMSGKLDTNVRFVITKPELGRKVESPDATRLNVPRTMARLQDRHGAINLTVPIRGSFDDRKFNLGQIVGNAVLGRIRKIAALPFVPLLAILDVGSGEKRWSILFSPGQATVAAPDAAKIRVVAEALAKDPTLYVEIAAHADPRRDGPATVAPALAWRRAEIVRDALALSVPGAVARLFVTLPIVAPRAGSSVELRLKKG